MAIDDRKKRILDHIAKSSQGIKFSVTKTTTKSSPPPNPVSETVTPVPPPQPEPPPPPKTISQKRQVMAHVRMSSGDFGDFSLSSDKRKQQIREHIRKSQG